MRIFVAGASGALGSYLVPQLLERGHDVVAMTRSPEKAPALRAAGAEPVTVDALDRAAIVECVRRAEPEVLVHELTALAKQDIRHFDRTFALTNRLRTEGTDHLLAGAEAAGARRFVAWSYAGWPYAWEGGPVKSEEDPLLPDPPAEMRRTVEAMRRHESTVLGAGRIEGIVLRYGAFYGPGSSIAEGGDQVELVRRRKLPIVGNGGAVWSFIHLTDAASATVTAIERAEQGVFNVVDDDPAPVSEWLPVLAEVVGAKPPRQVPAWLGRLLIGEHGVGMMTRTRGASNAKIKRELGWRPTFASWRRGFADGLGERRHGSAAV